jgi:hypothetical protein
MLLMPENNAHGFGDRGCPLAEAGIAACQRGMDSAHGCSTAVI